MLSNIDSQSRIVIDEAICRIASDNTSGAAEILRSAATVFILLNEMSSEHCGGDFEVAQQDIIETCVALASAQPEMSPLLRLASAALSAAQTATSAPDSWRRAGQAALSFIANAERAAHDAGLQSATLIRDHSTVLTHSRSSTVLAAFVEARRAGRRFSVFATESRPMLEGRALAEALAGQGIPVTLIADAAACLVMDDVDLVIVGADKVTPVNLINKIGTRMIALAARERGLPVYALCDSSKFIRDDYLDTPLSHPGRAGELWPDAPGGVAVANRFFEPTPLTCFTGIVTEDGPLSSTEAAIRAEDASINSVLVSALGVSRETIK